MQRTNGQGNAKCGASSFARTFGSNRASVQLNYVPRDRQAQPQTGMHSRAGCISLSKPIENIRQEILADAYARITHGYFEIRVRPRDPDRHVSLARSKLDGV